MKAVSLTNRGGRENNEDCVRYAENGDACCFVLCDGLGGHAGGEVASVTAAEEICASFLQNPDVSVDVLKEHLKNASARIAAERENAPALFNMSTTAVALITDGETAVWAHIGDSRLYYIEDGRIAYVTDDHSIAFMEFQSGAITYDDIRRSPNQNKLLRCIGNDNSAADTHEAYIKQGDAFLLCSDGFWEYVNESDIETALKSAKNPKAWLEAMLAALHRKETVNNDNYSAIAVMI